MTPEIKRKRAYAPASASDGYRMLIDRLWPRGLSRESAALDEWQPALAPSSGLRSWFRHDPDRWQEFRRRYLTELTQNPAVDHFLEKHGNRRTVTLVYAAREEMYHHAVLLQEYLISRLARAS